jgi:hypothetical protein
MIFVFIFGSTGQLKCSGKAAGFSSRSFQPGDSALPGWADLWSYDAGRDAGQPANEVRLDVDLRALGVAGAKRAKIFSPGAEAVSRELRDNALTAPEVGLWAMIKLRAE